MARCEPGRRGARRVIQGALAAAIAIGVAGCGGDSHPAVDAGPPPPTWWQPQLGQAKDWDIQLSPVPGDVDVSMPRLMYDLDLWALVPSDTRLDYGDGMPLTVHAGALAGTIAQLHARTPSTIVICHVETGALEMGRPDSAKFPAAAIGGDVPDLAMAKFLDVSRAGRAMWKAAMFKRFDLARLIGCDGIEPSHNDVGAYSGTGFTIPTEDTYSWYGEIATQGHQRMLSTGMKDADLVNGAIDVGANQFDWLMTERCGETMACDAVKPFLDLAKPVFAIDYNVNLGDDSTDPPTPPAPQSAASVCMEQDKSGIPDGIYKDVALTKAVRTQCVP